MAKRKLTSTKSSTKRKNGTNKMTGVKIKKILEHVSTEDFMKFNNPDLKARTSPITTTTDSITLVKGMKSPKVKIISKKDKMRLKKQRFLKKIDIISADVKKGLLKKRNKKLKDNQHNPEKSATLFNDVALEDKIVTKEICNTICKKVQLPLEGSKANKAIDIKDSVSSCKPNKASEKSKKPTIFKKAKKNSNKNRQRNFMNGLSTYKKQMKNEEYVEDPIKAISERVNAYARKETAV